MQKKVAVGLISCLLIAALITYIAYEDYKHAQVKNHILRADEYGTQYNELVNQSRDLPSNDYEGMLGNADKRININYKLLNEYQQALNYADSNEKEYLDAAIELCFILQQQDDLTKDVSERALDEDYSGIYYMSSVMSNIRANLDRQNAKVSTLRSTNLDY